MHLGVKEMDFKQAYMRTDEAEDYVARSQPCPMLQPDNTCQIYEARPSDCARFPYTDENVFFKKPKLTATNAQFCPIVADVLTALVI